MNLTEQWNELKSVLLTSLHPSEYFASMDSARLDSFFPELKALKNVEQDPIHHPEGNVWNHTMQVLDTAASLRAQAEYPLGLMLSALCHDFGKLTATTVENGRIRSIGHEQQGLPLTKTILRRFTDDPRLTSHVLSMVELHMRPNLLSTQSSGIKALCRLFELSPCPEDLLLLAKADHCSRTNASPYDETEGYLRSGLAEYRRRCALPGVEADDLLAAGLTPGPAFDEGLLYARKLRLAGVEKASAMKQTLARLRQSDSRNPGQRH